MMQPPYQTYGQLPVTAPQIVAQPALQPVALQGNHVTEYHPHGFAVPSPGGPSGPAHMSQPPSYMQPDFHQSGSYSVPPGHHQSSMPPGFDQKGTFSIPAIPAQYHQSRESEHPFTGRTAFEYNGHAAAPGQMTQPAAHVHAHTTASHAAAAQQGIAELKRKAADQGSNGGSKKAQNTSSGSKTAVDQVIRSLRTVLKSKAQQTAERCAAEGLSEMIPEVHGYGLYRVKEDYKLMMGQELDMKLFDGLRLQQIVTKHASDIVTIVMTFESAAVLLPCCGQWYGSVQAPARMAPAKAPARAGPSRVPHASVSAQVLQQQNGIQPSAAMPVLVQGGNSASQEVAPAMLALEAAAPMQRPMLSSHAAPKLLRAAIKYVKRRILATRFHLYQEAYRAMLAAGTSLGHLIPGTPVEKVEVCKAADPLAPGLAWPLESIIPALYRLAADIRIDAREVDALDLRAVLRGVEEDEMPNPFKLVKGNPAAAAGMASQPRGAVQLQAVHADCVAPGLGQLQEPGQGDGAASGPTGLRLPPELAGCFVVPMLGHALGELKMLREVWLCLHTVLPQFHDKRAAALAKALARKEVTESALPTTYPVAWLREKYKSQYGRALHIMRMAFGDLVELLQWDLFAPVVRIDDACVQGEKGLLVPLFDVLGDVRTLLEEQMEGVLAQQLRVQEQQGRNSESQVVAAPSLIDIQKAFRLRYLYDPDPDSFGFVDFHGLVAANWDLCSVTGMAPPHDGSSTVSPNCFTRLRALVKVLLGQQQQQGQQEEPGRHNAASELRRLAPVSDAVRRNCGGAIPSGVLLLTNLEQLYQDVYREPFSAASVTRSARDAKTVAGALAFMQDVCTVREQAVLPPDPAEESSVMEKIRMRSPRFPVNPHVKAKDTNEQQPAAAGPSGSTRPSAPYFHGGAAAGHPQAAVPPVGQAPPGSLGPMRRASQQQQQQQPVPLVIPGLEGLGPAGMPAGLNPDVLAMMLMDMAQGVQALPTLPALPDVPVALASGALPFEELVSAALALGMPLPLGGLPGVLDVVGQLPLLPDAALAQFIMSAAMPRLTEQEQQLRLPPPPGILEPAAGSSMMPMVGAAPAPAGLQQQQGQKHAHQAAPRAPHSSTSTEAQHHGYPPQMSGYRQSLPELPLNPSHSYPAASPHNMPAIPGLSPATTAAAYDVSAGSAAAAVQPQHHPGSGTLSMGPMQRQQVHDQQTGWEVPMGPMQQQQQQPPAGAANMMLNQPSQQPHQQQQQGSPSTGPVPHASQPLHHQQHQWLSSIASDPMQQQQQQQQQPGQTQQVLPPTQPADVQQQQQQQQQFTGMPGTDAGESMKHHWYGNCNGAAAAATMLSSYHHTQPAAVPAAAAPAAAASPYSQGYTQHAPSQPAAPAAAAPATYGQPYQHHHYYGAVPTGIPAPAAPAAAAAPPASGPPTSAAQHAQHAQATPAAGPQPSTAEMPAWHHGYAAVYPAQQYGQVTTMEAQPYGQYDAMQQWQQYYSNPAVQQMQCGQFGPQAGPHAQQYPAGGAYPGYPAK